MPLTPGYGETPLPHDELTALLPEVADILGKPITRAAVYDLEQGLQDRAFDELMPPALDGSLPLDELLSDYFVRDLHTRIFGPVWNWAGQSRRLELNIGVAPEQIAVELRNALDTIAYRWEHTDDWRPRQLGIVVHAETVRMW
jgi:fido (protein-threonine AMPylation protein)